MRWATRCPDVPNPGELSGQDMASFHSLRPCEMAGAASVEAAAATPAVAAP